MLKLCTSIMKKELKCVKREGATILYIRQLGTIFYQTLLDVVEEFRKIFPESSACLASLVIWSNSELTHFMSHVIKQIFVPQSGLSIISECVSCLREKNSQVYIQYNYYYYYCYCNCNCNYYYYYIFLTCTFSFVTLD